MTFVTSAAEILAFLSAEAAAVAIYRIFRIARGLPIPYMVASATSPRSLLLWAFAAYMLGSTGREAVVMAYGMTGWPEVAVLMSNLSRVVQIGGATLFLYALTFQQCGHRVWGASLALAVLFAVVA